MYILIYLHIFYEGLMNHHNGGQDSGYDNYMESLVLLVILRVSIRVRNGIVRGF